MVVREALQEAVDGRGVKAGCLAYMLLWPEHRKTSPNMTSSNTKTSPSSPSSSTCQ